MSDQPLEELLLTDASIARLANEIRPMLAEQVAAVLDQRRSVDERTHRLHHDYVAQQIMTRKEVHEMRKKILQQVLGWGIIALVGGLGAAIWHWVETTLGGSS